MMEEMSRSLKGYVDEDCANLIAQFFSAIGSSIISTILPKISRIESGIIPSRTFMEELKSELEKAFTTINVPDQTKEKIKDCFVKLLKSGWIQEEIPRITKSMISEELKRLERYEESKILLDIFHKACEKDLSLVFSSWCNHYLSERFEEFMYKLFDGIRSLQQLTQFEEDFETQAILILSSFQILSETYYRRLISFLIDLLRILEGKTPKKEVEFIGRSYHEFVKNYKEKYPNLKIFFNETIKNIRNSVGHADYEIDVKSKEIIIKDRGKILHRLNEDEIRKVFEYLFKMTNISVHFYWYSSLYFAENLIWNLIFETKKQP